MRAPRSPVLLLLLALCALPARGQEPPAPPESPPPPPPAAVPPPAQPAPPAPPTSPDVGLGGQQPPGTEGVTSTRPRDQFLPRLDVYFPEGDLDLRVNRLVNKVFFEGQVKYNFVSGDISAFLRYRYYGYRRITQFTVFDAISFPTIDRFSSDFDRVRGALMLFEWPHDYSRRTFALVEVDRIASNRPEQQFNNNRTNNFVRVGYQLGTPNDSRMNAIVGESRAITQSLFTAVQEIGPGGFGLTAAATYGFDFLAGDFRYVRTEAEALKRFDVSDNTFLVGRVHNGSFPYKMKIRGPDVAPLDQYSIPRSEFFALGGRDKLRGLKHDDSGSEELHTTWEYFFPWFLGAHRDFLHAEWQNWYWIIYAGYGTVGFDRKVYSDFNAYIPDVGLGFESSVRLKGKFRFFVSGIVARTLKGNGGVEARFSVKSYR